MWYIVVGLLSGVLGAMGMGGGTILIPMLVTFFAVEQKQAQFINLIAFVFMAIIAVIMHKKSGLINIGAGTVFAISGAVFSLIFSLITLGLQSKFLSRLFGGFLIFVGIINLFGIIKKTKTQKQKKH